MATPALHLVSHPEPEEATHVLQVTLAPNGVVTGIQLQPVLLAEPGRPVPDPEKRAIGIVRTLSKEDFGNPLLDEEGRWRRR